MCHSWTARKYLSIVQLQADLFDLNYWGLGSSLGSWVWVCFLANGGLQGRTHCFLQLKTVSPRSRWPWGGYKSWCKGWQIMTYHVQRDIINWKRARSACWILSSIIKSVFLLCCTSCINWLNNLNIQLFLKYPIISKFIHEPPF